MEDYYGILLKIFNFVKRFVRRKCCMQSRKATLRSLSECRNGIYLICQLVVRIFCVKIAFASRFVSAARTKTDIGIGIVLSLYVNSVRHFRLVLALATC